LAGVDTTAWTVQLSNVRLLYQKAEFANNMVTDLYSRRIAEVPLELPFSYVRYAESASTSASTTSFNAFVNGQSVNEIAIMFRPDTYATPASSGDRFKSYFGGATATPQNTTLNVSWNGSPLLGFEPNGYEALMITQMSLNGNNNILFAPDSESDTDMLSDKFALIANMELMTTPEDGKGWVVGVSTNNQSVEVSGRLTSGDTVAKKPVILVWQTGSISIGAGRQISIAE